MFQDSIILQIISFLVFVLVSGVLFSSFIWEEEFSDEFEDLSFTRWILVGLTLATIRGAF